ncbi:MAG TPA: hypothetical protein VFU02_24065, partial [Polyangiaceae bacterium]|nr:hypothetical protein [Polyangiaceae bacterium]
NLQRWSHGVEKTACRVGMLLANDLPAAHALLEREEGKRGDYAKDLIAFTTSEPYFALRRELGIAIDQN